jgi:hypothetical protein
VTAAGGGDSKKEKDLPDAVCVYVRSEKAIWVWNRYDQAWEVQQFTAPLIKVKLIKGGILAVAPDGAAIYDCQLGRWLTRLHPGGEPLTDGDSE